MGRIFVLSALLLLSRAASSDIIGMSVCNDFGEGGGRSGCTTECTKWASFDGSCTVCDSSKGACSNDNPSSRTSLSRRDGQITFYSDSSCASVVNWPGPANGTYAFQLNGQCQVLVPGSLSVRAINISQAIGVAIGIIAGIIGVICLVVFGTRAMGYDTCRCSCCLCECGRPRKKPLDQYGMVAGAPPVIGVPPRVQPGQLDVYGAGFSGFSVPATKAV